MIVKFAGAALPGLNQTLITLLMINVIVDNLSYTDEESPSRDECELISTGVISSEVARTRTTGK